MVLQSIANPKGSTENGGGKWWKEKDYCFLLVFWWFACHFWLRWKRGGGGGGNGAGWVASQYEVRSWSMGNRRAQTRYFYTVVANGKVYLGTPFFPRMATSLMAAGQWITNTVIPDVLSLLFLDRPELLLRLSVRPVSEYKVKAGDNNLGTIDIRFVRIRIGQPGGWCRRSAG